MPYKQTKEGKRRSFIWKTCSLLVQWGLWPFLRWEDAPASWEQHGLWTEEGQGGEPRLCAAEPTECCVWGCGYDPGGQGAMMPHPSSMGGTMFPDWNKKMRPKFSLEGKGTRIWHPEISKPNVAAERLKLTASLRIGFQVGILSERGEMWFSRFRNWQSSFVLKNAISVSYGCLLFYNSFSKLHSSTDLFFIFYYGNCKHTQKLTRMYLTSVQTWFSLICLIWLRTLKNINKKNKFEAMKMCHYKVLVRSQ